MRSMDAKTLKSKFGRRVRALRHLRDWTQEELAEITGLSPEYIGDIERGQASPSFTVLARLASALDVEPKSLFEFSELSR